MVGGGAGVGAGAEEQQSPEWRERTVSRIRRVSLILNSFTLKVAGSEI